MSAIITPPRPHGFTFAPEVAPAPTIAELGAPALATFRGRFKCPGLLKVARLAVEAEAKAENYVALQAQQNALSAERDALPAGDPRRFTLSVALEKLGQRLSVASTEAMVASKGVFQSVESRRLIGADARRLVDALEAELERIVDAQRKFHTSQGWGEVARAHLGETNPAFRALSDFLEQHARPLAVAYETDLACGCTSLSVPDPQSSSWVLIGADWRTVLK